MFFIQSDSLSHSFFNVLCSSAPSPAASKAPEDRSWLSSQHGAEASSTAATSEQPLTSTLTTAASTTSPASHTPFISAVHSAPFIIPYPSEDHSFISALYSLLMFIIVFVDCVTSAVLFLLASLTFSWQFFYLLFSIFGCVSHGGLSCHGLDRSVLGQVRCYIIFTNLVGWNTCMNK